MKTKKELTCVAIVVTYNGEKVIEKCLNSLKNSNFPVSVVIIDNASTDSTVEIVKQNFKEMTLMQSRKNLGFGRANNIGLKWALENDADFVFLINQDAWVKPETIGVVISVSQSNPEYGILSPVHMDETGDRLDLNFSASAGEFSCPYFFSDLFAGKDLKAVYEVDSVNATSWFITRECLNKVGGFDPVFFMYGEDGNFVMRTKYHGFKIGIVPGVTITHARAHSALIKKNSMIKYRSSLYFQYAHWLSELTDLNADYTTLWFNVLRRVVVKCCHDTIFRNWRELPGNIEAICMLGIRASTISKHRKIARSSNYAFLQDIDNKNTI